MAGLYGYIFSVVQKILKTLKKYKFIIWPFPGIRNPGTDVWVPHSGPHRLKSPWLLGLESHLRLGPHPGSLVCMLSRVQLFATPWTVACQAPLSMGFSRQEWEKVKVTQSCPTLCDLIAYTVHGILQARIWEWVAFPFSRGSSQPRDQPQVSHIAGGFFTSWATMEAQEYWSG